MDETKRPSLRMKHIDKISEVYEAIEFCENLDIPDDGLQTLEDYKDRLRCHYYAQKHGNYKTSISKAISESGDENAKKREQLIDILRQVLKVTEVEQVAPLLDDFLEREGTTSNLHDDCEGRIDNLRNGECILLTAGETSAGKSSVLNLMFEEEILPVFAGSCTSTITSVRYGHRCAKIVYKNSELPIEEIHLDEEGKKRFNDLVFMRGNEREDGHSIKEIQLYLPLAFLKSGLVLADSPGIGETQFLEDYLIDYISKNQILGFTYVIMSDAAGGVKEDRLLLLLKIIIEEQKKRKHSLPFDPKAAMFICNRFDAIPDEDKEHVQQHIITHLQKFWPEFDPSMAVFFSAQNAQRDVSAHPDYINEQYRNMLEATRKLVNVAMDRRIKASYKWVEKLLQRITHFLKTMVKRLDMSEKERQSKSSRIRTKLTNLTSNTQTVIYTLKTEIREMTDRIVSDLKLYLQKPQVKFKLCSAWKEDEIPKLTDEVTNVSHWKWIKSRVDQAFYLRLCKLLDEWGDESCDISELESRIVDDIKAKLGVLEEEVCKIEQDMRIDTTSRSSSTSDDDTTSLRGTLGRRSSSRLSFSFNSGATLINTPTKLPLQVLTMVQQDQPSNIVSRFSIRRSTLTFTKNPEAWARERAEKLLSKLVKDKQSKKNQASGEGILRQLVTQLLQRPLAFLEMVEQKIPSIIKADENILQAIEVACLTDKKNFVKYEEMMINVESLRNRLKEYGEGYIFVDDFKSNEIKILEPVKTGQSFARTFTVNVRDMIASGHSEDNMKMSAASPRGLWTVVNPGVLTEADTQRHIAIRFYLPSSGIENTFAEVAKLKCLTSDDVPLAEFLGIHHAEVQLPAFIYSGNLQTVQRYLLLSSNPQAAVSSILHETAEAVGFISGKGLVHMELSTSTITVNEHGQVKITGACLPRKATLPLDEETVAGDFVYLAPEVLNGDLYITPADVYGFGLFMYELLTKRIAFKKQRGFPLQSFKKSLNPEAILFDPSNSGEVDSVLSQKSITVIKQCLAVNESERIPFHKIIESMQNIKGQFRRSISWKTGSTPGSIFRQSSSSKEKNSH